MRLRKVHKYQCVRNQPILNPMGWRVKDIHGGVAWRQIIFDIAWMGRVIHPLRGYSDIPF